MCVLGFWLCICFYSFWLDFGTVLPAVWYFLFYLIDKTFQIVSLWSVGLQQTFFTKFSHCFLFCFLQSVLIAFFFVFLQSFFLYDLKNNCTRKCCARNSWFFSTILLLYHIRPSTNCWLFVCCNPTD
jgi:hypothetical protein